MVLETAVVTQRIQQVEIISIFETETVSELALPGSPSTKITVTQDMIIGTGLASGPSPT